MRSLSLNRSASVVLDVNGNGTAALGPSFPGESWLPVSTSISCTGNQPTPTAPAIATCFVYAGNAVNNSTFVDATYQVLGASSGMIDGQVIYPGTQVYAVWSNCNPGQVATLTVNGKRNVP
jgi:hypothetical protein